MNLEHYEYDQLDEFTYRFYSVGRNGTFEMRVQFVEMGYRSYNLGFGVVDPASEWLDDLVELRNGDTQTILSTVAGIALKFLNEHSWASLYASGSTPSRTRMYQMGLNRVLSKLTDYSVAGLITKRDFPPNIPGNYQGWKDEWQEFRSGVPYKAFLIFKGKLLT